MVVHDAHMVSRAIFPLEDNSPLAVNSNAVTAAQVAAQRFEPVPGGRPQVLNGMRVMDHIQLSPGGPPDISRDAQRLF